MPKEKILIVDDEEPINELISSYLKKEGFVPFSAFSGQEAIQLFHETSPDLIILDVMLPDIEGIDVCLELRKTTNVPILFLSCKGEEIDKIIALSVGGDDYITKPFLPGELIARIKANLRRNMTQSNQDFQEPGNNMLHRFPGLTMDVEEREVLVDGSPVPLLHKEFEILKLFIENPKRIFSAIQIFESVWKTPCLDGDTRTVMVYISTLRKKIETNPSNPKYIASVRGLGYKLNYRNFK